MAALTTRAARLPARLAVVLCALAVAVAAGAERRQGLEPTSTPMALDASGALSIASSREGQAIVSADAMRPGAVAVGTVSIRNSGGVAGAFTLASSGLTEVAGPGGGLLADRLHLRVEQLGGATATTLYAGGLKAMTPIALPEKFAPGESRDYRFTVTLLDGGVPASSSAGDNAYQGASASVRFDWNAIGDEPPPPPAPAPAPAPAAPAPAPAPKPPAPAPTPPATPAPIVEVTAPRTYSLAKPGVLPIAFDCAKRCGVAATAKLTGAPALEKLKLRVVRSTAGPDRGKLSIALTKADRAAVRRVLRKTPKVTLVVSMRVTEAGGGRRTVVQRIRLKR